MIRNGLFSLADQIIMKLMPGYFRQVLVIACMVVMLGGWRPAVAVEPAGVVLMAAGNVVAIQADNKPRPLQRRSPFFPGEVLRTDETAQAQVRFRDGSVISLRAQTAIRIDEFRFNEPAQGEDRNVFTLLNGGFRTITGTIGKQNPAAYRARTPVATIGVRGTVYEAVLGQELAVAAWQGGIVVENQGGSIRLGVGGAYNYAVIASERQAPRGTLRLPAILKDATPPPPAESEPVRDAGKGEAEDAAGDAAGDGASPDPAVAGTTTDAVADGSLDIADGTTSAPLLETATVTIVDTVPMTETAQGVPADVAAATTTTPSDQRLLNVTLDRLGLSVVNDIATPGYLAAGQASDGGTGSPVISDNGLDPSQPGFFTAPAVKVLHQGNAVLDMGVFQSNLAGLGVAWGAWQAGAGAAAELQTDASDATIFTAIDQPVYWLTATPISAAAYAGLTGTASYYNLLNVMGGGSSGPLADMYLNLSLDFTTASYTGKARIKNGEKWDLILAGDIANAVLLNRSITGSIDGAAATITGDFGAVMVGNTGNALAGAFDLQDATRHIEGLFLADNTPVDLRLANVPALDRIGMMGVATSFTAGEIHIGRANDGATGSPIFAMNAWLPGDPAFLTDPAQTVASQGQAPLQGGVAATYAAYGVSWGIWQGSPALPALLQTDAADPLVTSPADMPLTWLTVVPTANAVLGGLSGQGRYSSAALFQGLDHMGMAPWTAQFNTVVDFGTAQFYGTAFLENQSNYSFADWQLIYDGNIIGPRLNVINLSGVHYGPTYSGAPIVGNLAMVFNGPNAEALAGTFNLGLGADPNVFLTGNFIAERDLRLTEAEAATLDRAIVGSVGGPGTGGALLGLGSDGSGGSPLIGLNGWSPDSKNFATWRFNDVMRQGGAPNLGPTTTTTSYQVGTPDPGYQVSWGAWDGMNTPFVKQSLALNPANQTLVSQPLYWMTLVPSSSAALATRTGTLVYSNPVMIAGGGTGGPISPASFSFSATVDFTNAMVSSGAMNFNAGTDAWQANFAGSISGPTLYISPTSILRNGVDPGTGSIKAVFTGPKAEAIGGSFDFETAGLAGVEGVFLVNCTTSGGC